MRQRPPALPTSIRTTPSPRSIPPRYDRGRSPFSRNATHSFLWPHLRLPSRWMRWIPYWAWHRCQPLHSSRSLRPFPLPYPESSIRLFRLTISRFLLCSAFFLSVRAFSPRALFPGFQKIPHYVTLPFPLRIRVFSPSRHPRLAPESCHPTRLWPRPVRPPPFCPF